MNDKEYLNKCVKRAYKINRNFFGFDINFDIKHNIKLVYSRKEFNKYYSGKTPKWMCATVNKKCMILIMAPSVFEKLTTHKLITYKNTITHEMNHIFFERMIGTYKPFWLEEGLAMNIDRIKYRYKGVPKTKFLFYSYQKEEYFKNAKEFYRNSYLMTKKLLKKLGKIRLFELLRLYSKKPTKDNYIRLFSKYLKTIY